MRPFGRPTAGRSTGAGLFDFDRVSRITELAVSRYQTGLLFLVLLAVLVMPAAAGDDGPLRAMPASEAWSFEVPQREWHRPPSTEPLPPVDDHVRLAQFNAAPDVELDVPDSHPIAVIGSDIWRWQVVPAGLLYPSYLAGVREPRIGVQLFHEAKYGWLWDGSIGGRIGLLRYGTADPLWPEGWQLDAETGAFPRLSADEDGNLISADYRYGFGLTQRRGCWESKFAFYHLSSHLGDEYMLGHAGLDRINFSRFVLVLGGAFYPWDGVRVYGETGYGFYTDGGSEPWEFQFGVDYSPLSPSRPCGAPFFAVNGHLRQEVDFGGNLTLQTGWQWRGETGRLARVGLHYLNGQSDQYEFFREHEQQIGVGFWYDF
jgi:hypothetical protein